MNKKLTILIGVLVLAVLIIGFVNKYIINDDENAEKVSFNAKVLENNGNSILVEPEEGSWELKSSDRIVVRVPENDGLKDLSEFTEGSKVKITYDGMIMESYPAQINAFKVDPLN